jgi:hypothetical protein
MPNSSINHSVQKIWKNMYSLELVSTFPIASGIFNPNPDGYKKVHGCTAGSHM